MSDQTKPVTGTPIDLDGDRETDALLNGPFDVSGNGVADTVTADVDFDGNPDAAIMDLDEDGEIESVATAADLDGDGRDESAIVDVGMDGEPELVVADVVGDGSADVLVADTDLDGVFDTAVVDSDNDGVFDTAVVDSDNDGVFDTILEADSGDATIGGDVGYGSHTDSTHMGGVGGHDHAVTTFGYEDHGGGMYDSTDEASFLGDTGDTDAVFGSTDGYDSVPPTDMTAVDDASGSLPYDGGIADYSSVDDSSSYSMIQDYSDDTSLQDPVTATDAWENGLGQTYQTNTEASNEAYQQSTDAWLAGDQEAAYDLNQQSLEYGATADQAWDTYSTWDSSSSSSDSGEY